MTSDRKTMTLGMIMTTAKQTKMPWVVGPIGVRPGP
jgi:hypothetical protein